MTTEPEPTVSRADRPASALAAIVGRIAEGDQASLARLYDDTVSWVYGLAIRILRDCEAAEDVCLDVYHSAWQRASTFDPVRGSVTSWLLAMTRSRSIDRLRSRQSSERRETELGREALHRMDPSPLPDVQAQLTDQNTMVRRALKSLPLEQREVIELAFFEGLSHGKIAQRLDMPLGTVKTRIRIGIRDLAGRLESLGGQR